METTLDENTPDSLTSGIHEIPGEPAMVITGVPPVSATNDGGLLFYEVASDMNPQTNECLGDWLEGRDVQKLFGAKLYNGKVTNFDKESGWYRVVYDDGDFEDLEWHELEQVLLPLDITIPLKTLASKMIKKRQKHEKRCVKSVIKSNKSHQNKEFAYGVDKMEV